MGNGIQDNAAVSKVEPVSIGRVSVTGFTALNGNATRKSIRQPKKRMIQDYVDSNTVESPAEEEEVEEEEKEPPVKKVKLEEEDTAKPKKGKKGKKGDKKGGKKATGQKRG